MDDFLNIIATKVCANQNLCKLLYYDSDNPLSEADISDTTIIYNNGDITLNKLLFTPFVFELIESATVKMFVEFDDLRTNLRNEYFNKATINFVICVDNKLWKITDGSNQIKLRPHMIISELNGIFDLKQTLGIGRNFLDRMKRVRFSDMHSGYIYPITLQDFKSAF